MSAPGPRGAFTLIELLVVISIIALLVGILLPVLGRSRYNARLMIDSSNLRQLRIGFESYATDHNGQFPKTPDNNAEWNGTELHELPGPAGELLVEDYLGGNFEGTWCPFWLDKLVDENRTPKSIFGPSLLVQGGPPDGPTRASFGYTVTTHWRLDPELNGGSEFRGNGEINLRPLSVEHVPSNVVVLADYLQLNGISTWEGFNDAKPPHYRGDDDPLIGVGLPDGGYRAFVDGSVKWASWPRDQGLIDLQSTWDPNVPFDPDTIQYQHRNGGNWPTYLW